MNLLQPDERPVSLLQIGTKQNVAALSGGKSSLGDTKVRIGIVYATTSITVLIQSKSVKTRRSQAQDLIIQYKFQVIVIFASSEMDFR